MFAQMKDDIQAVFERDPAARSALEVVMTYSGLHAIWGHRIAHKLWKAEWYTLARIVSQVTRFSPGSKFIRARELAEACLSTTVWAWSSGRHVKSATMSPSIRASRSGNREGKRQAPSHNRQRCHYRDGAKVLGSFKIGDNSKIGAGAVVLQEVPPNSTVVGIKARIVIQDGKRVKHDLDHVNMPDPVADTIRLMQRKSINCAKNWSF